MYRREEGVGLKAHPKVVWIRITVLGRVSSGVHAMCPSRVSGDVALKSPECDLSIGKFGVRSDNVG